MRYVTIPPPIDILNPLTDEAMDKPERMSFAKSVRAVLSVIAAKGQTDAYALFDIRRKVDAASVGSTVELTDAEWDLLAPEFRKPDPRVFQAQWVFSAEPHMRAITDAPSKLPVVLALPANGADAS